jgi:hypothetical protein
VGKDRRGHLARDRDLDVSERRTNVMGPGFRRLPLSALLSLPPPVLDLIHLLDELHISSQREAIHMR